MTEPRLRIVRGDPTPEEIAALVAALSAVAARPAAALRPPRSRWSDPALRLRKTPARGPDAWRTRSLPI